MRAIAVTEIGAAPAPRDLPVPEPGPGEARVRLLAAGVNPLDWRIADGLLKDEVPYTFPLVLGLDGAGVVDAAGEGCRFGPGEQVYGRFFGVPRGLGSYAEYTVFEPGMAVEPMPPSLVYSEAAAVPTPAMAAVQIADETELRTGTTVLVVGATGGVGQFTVQVAADRGAMVIATARHEMAEELRGLGAAETVDHGRGPIGERVRTLRPDGVDVIVDLVGDRAATERLVPLLAPDGVYLSTTWALNPDALESQDVLGINLELAASAGLLERAGELIESGRLRVPALEQVALEDAPDALARSRAGGARGRTVLRI